jgi:hypothetical protein
MLTMLTMLTKLTLSLTLSLALVATFGAPGVAAAAPVGQSDSGDRVGQVTARFPAFFDDRDLFRAGGWSSVTSATAIQKTLSKSTAKGATLRTKAVTYGGGSVKLEFGPGRGKATILVGGVRRKTVDTAAAEVTRKTVRYHGVGKVVIKVSRPKGGVYVDSLTLGQSTPSPTSPLAGELIFTEWLSHPSAVPETDGEWFELTSVTEKTLVLMDCDVTNQAMGTVHMPWLTLSPNEIALMARSSEGADNGGLPPPQGTFGFELSPSGSLTLTCDGVTVDTVSWTSETAGKSTSLDLDHYTAADNDVTANYCVGSQAYGDGDMGTPWSFNAQCP